MGAVAYVALLVLVGRDVATNDKLVVTVALFAVYLGIAILRPKFAIVAVIIAAFTLDGAVAAMPALPARLPWLQEVMLLALGGGILVHAGRVRTSRTTPLDGAVAALLSLGVLSVLVNQVPPAVAVLGFRNYWKYLLLYYAIVGLELDEQFRRRLVGLVIGLAVLQVPVAIYQLMTRSIISGDTVSGTLGMYASGTLTILMLGVVSIIAGWFLYREKRTAGYIMLMAVLMIPPALNETKVLFFAAPLLFAFVLFRRGARKSARSLAVLVAAGVILFASFQAYDAFYGSRRDVSVVFSERYLREYLLNPDTPDGTLNRLPAVPFALNDIAQSASTLALGHGPGDASDSTFEFGVGRLFQRYARFNLDSTFLVRFLLEYGLLGIVAFAWLVGACASVLRQVTARETDSFWYGVHVGWEGLLLLMVVLAVYTGTFTADALAATFWLLAGLVVRRLQELSEAEEREQREPSTSATVRVAA